MTQCICSSSNVSVIKIVSTITLFTFRLCPLVDSGHCEVVAFFVLKAVQRLFGLQEKYKVRHSRLARLLSAMMADL